MSSLRLHPPVVPGVCLAGHRAVFTGVNLLDPLIGTVSAFLLSLSRGGVASLNHKVCGPLCAAASDFIFYRADARRAPCRDVSVHRNASDRPPIGC